MIIFRLTYYSRNRLDPLVGSIEEQVRDISRQAIDNNRRDHITGALIHDDKWFAQELEGPEMAVSAAFERVLRDHRHSDVRLVKMQPVPLRRFAAWPMACVPRADDNADLFHHHCEGECFDPQLMRADRLGDLIEAVVARLPPRPGEEAAAHGRVTYAA
jgi:Sensors of blue-light using FAD